ncbi:MAG: proprotein convertase P-domain-containing protein [Silvanigrellaceae bacterium]
MAASSWNRVDILKGLRGGVSACLIAGALFAHNANASILPPNNLHMQDNLHSLANITEQDFNNIVNTIINLYKPIVAAKGATLKSNNLWTDATVNASAQQVGTSWIVNMYGGLARRPEVTPDGFAMVVCHELGHHLGGFPFYGDNDWAASEGQSDYFATQSCAREIWRNQVAENARYRGLVGDFEKNKCDAAWNKSEDQDLCYRAAAAGKSLATLLGALRSGSTPPRFETPDPRRVAATYTAHPEAQCRLDTYFNGALCPVGFDKNVIPGRSTTGGQTNKDSELKASASSCMTAAGYANGVRPLCWFKPQLEFLAIQYSDARYQEQSGNNNGVVEPGETVEAFFRLANRAVNPTTNIEAVLSSPSAKLQVLEGKAQFSDMNSGETSEAKSPFVFKVAETSQCGEKIPVTLKAKSDQGAVELTREVTLGRQISSELGTVATQVNIPDNDPVGIDSNFESTIAGSASGFALKLDIEHPYVRDLRVSVFSPDGKEYKVYPTANSLKGRRTSKTDGRLDTGIHETIQVDSRVEKIEGAWKLRVKDVAARDNGTLQGWSVTASKNQCDGQLKWASKRARAK